MNELKQIDNFDFEDHILRSYNWDSSEGWQDRLAKKLIPIIRQLYLDYEGLKQNLKDTEWDDEQIKKFIDNALKESIPVKSTDEKQSNFQIRRADFAELLSLICLEGLYETSIPAKSIFHRELTHMTGKGIDILGYEEVGHDMSLILCEVKGSSDKKSPPGVVDAGKDSLKNQLHSYISDKAKTLNRILNIHKKASPEHKEKLIKIAFWWSQDDITPLKVVVCPFLVRQSDKYKNSDFGSFKENPDHFKPSKVRFLIVCVHEDLVKLSNFIYEKARDANE